MKSSSIKLPFGLNKNNIIVHIENVESGDECDYFCPGCKVLLIVVKGSIKQHHFRHKNVKECKGGLESAIHLAAKQMIREKKKIMLPGYVCIASAKDSKGLMHTESKVFSQNAEIEDFDFVQEEKELCEMKVDILATKDGKLLIIEIYYRHKVDANKVEKIKNANISAIEINLSDLAPDDVTDSEAFWSYMNDAKHIQWLHNAKAHNIVYPDLANRLALKIQGLEKKYAADIEQLKALLVQDLKIVMMLRGKNHKAKPIKELKKNGVWQTHGEGSGLSLESLPNFLNISVLDGDWIFSCDRRIWQSIIYNSFICNNNREPYFFVREVAGHIKLYCMVPRCVERLQESARYHPQYLPSGALDKMPSPIETVKIYCNHLCDLGMLELSESESHQKERGSYKIISKTPNPVLYK